MTDKLYSQSDMDRELSALRERCAKVARDSKSYDDNLQKSAGCSTSGERIAKSIRALPITRIRRKGRAMPRSISFSMTTEQFLNGTKDVTRRMGWLNLTRGDVLCGVKKAMGLKKGEQIERLGLIRIVSVWRERLDDMLSDITYGHEEVRREGFPDWHPSKFVIFFCESHACKAHDIVTRIEFERIAPTPSEGER